MCTRVWNTRTGMSMTSIIDTPTGQTTRPASPILIPTGMSQLPTPTHIGRTCITGTGIERNGPHRNDTIYAVAPCSCRHFTHIKNYYYQNHMTTNPIRVVPAAAIIDFEAPYGRG